MVYMSIAYICTSVLFYILLEQKYKFITSAVVYILAFFVGLIAVQISSVFIGSETYFEPLSIVIHGSIMYIASLFMSSNNPAAKLFLLPLSLSNFVFMKLFIEYTIGLMPIDVSGFVAGVYSLLIFILFYLLIGICFYRYFHYFSDRDISGFDIATFLMQFIPFLFSYGLLDFTFKAHFLAGRIIMSFLSYIFIIFCFRSVYHGAKFRERSFSDSSYDRMVNLQSSVFTDMQTRINELSDETAQNEFALDSISIMMIDGQFKNVDKYIAAKKQTHSDSPLLSAYHENKYVNAVLATNSAYAKSLDINFESNVGYDGTFLKVSEFCIIANELLKKGIGIASTAEGERRIRLTSTAIDGNLNIEVIYSKPAAVTTETAVNPKAIVETLTKKGAKEIISYLFDDSSNIVEGLENTEAIVDRYSGYLNISSTDTDTIIKVEFTN